MNAKSHALINMKRLPTVAVKVFLINVEAARNAGVDIQVDELLSQHDVDSEILKDKDARVPLAVMRSLIDTCEKSLKNPVFGLHYHRFVNWNHGNDIKLLLDVSPDAHTAISIYFRYFGLMTEAGNFSLDIGTEKSAIHFFPNAQANISVHQIDANIAAFALFTRLLGWPAFEHIDVGHLCPMGCEHEYEKVFQCPVTFAGNHGVLRFASRLLKRKLSPKQRNLDGIAAFETRYNEQEGRMKLLTATRSLVKFALTQGEPSRERIASSLGLSVRTFQRRLSNQQTTFAEVVHTVRKEAAYDYIQQNIYSFDEVAFLLGYSDVRSFFRAFQQWHGCTPGEFRFQEKHHADNT